MIPCSIAVHFLKILKDYLGGLFNVYKKFVENPFWDGRLLCHTVIYLHPDACPVTSKIFENMFSNIWGHVTADWIEIITIKVKLFDDFVPFIQKEGNF